MSVVIETRNLHKTYHTNGLAGIRALMSWVATSIGFGPLDPWTDNLGMVLLLPEVVLLALMGAFIPAYSAGRTSVVEVLRHE